MGSVKFGNGRGLFPPLSTPTLLLSHPSVTTLRPTFRLTLPTFQTSPTTFYSKLFFPSDSSSFSSYHRDLLCFPFSFHRHDPLGGGGRGTRTTLEEIRSVTSDSHSVLPDKIPTRFEVTDPNVDSCTFYWC